jgi:hypothetical protein
VDGGCSSDPYNGQPGLYDAIKAGNPYAGQYSPALNEVADIFSHYNP